MSSTSNLTVDWYRQVLDIAPAAVIVCRAVRSKNGSINDLEYLFANKLALDSLRRSELTGKLWSKELPEAKQSGLFDICISVIDTGVPWSGEIKYAADQVDFWADFSIVKVDDGCAVSFQDISEKKQLEEAVQETKVLFRRVIDAPNLGLAVYKAVRNDQGLIIDFIHEYINSTTLAAVGQDFSGRLLTEHGENGITQLPRFIEAMTSGQTIRYLRQAEFPDGWHWISFSNSPVGNDWLVHIWEDVTEVKNAELELLRLKEESSKDATDKFELLEEAFQKSEYAFRSFTAASSDIVYKMSADWKHMQLLEGKDFLLSTVNSDAIWLDHYIPLQEKERVRAAIEEAIRKKKLFALEHQVWDRDGNIAWTYSRAIPMLDSEGNISEWIGAASDITVRKRKENNERFLRTISDTHVSGNSSMSTIEAMEQLAASVGRYFGVKWCMLSQMPNVTDIPVSAFGWNDASVASIKGAYRMRDFLSKEQLEKNNRGEIFIATDTQNDPNVNSANYDLLGIRSFIVVPLVQGNHWHFLLTIIDDKPRIWRDDEVELVKEIAIRFWTKLEKAQAEQAMRKSEEKYRDDLQDQVIKHTAEIRKQEHFISGVIHVLPDLVSVRDLINGTMEYINDEIENVLGISKKEFLAMTVEQRFAMIHEDYQDIVADYFKQFSTLQGDDQIEMEYQACKSGDEWRWFHARGKVFKRNEFGVATHSLNIVQNITQRKKAELENARLNKILAEKIRELAYVNSEIKTFNSIAATHYQDILKNVYLSFEQIINTEAKNLSDSGRANIRRAQTGVQRMGLLTDDLVTYTKLKEFDTLSEEVSLYQILQTVITEFESQRSHFAIENSCDGVPRISGYPFLLSLVFHHLLDNAIKFRKGDGVNVKLSCDITAEGFIVIAISDDGIGFTPDQHEKIFDMFYRGHEKSRYKGSGVGLAICKKIMELHGGYIEAFSGDGGGAEFRCYFPQP